MHYQSYYARIKVLTEKGKELATVEVPYLKGNMKVTDIKGRTIHADGTIIPLTVKPEDLLGRKERRDAASARRSSRCPAWKWAAFWSTATTCATTTTTISSPIWEIQRPYFVHKAHYQFTPFKASCPAALPAKPPACILTDERGRAVNSLIWWNHLPPGVTMKTSVNGSYTWM